MPGCRRMEAALGEHSQSSAAFSNPGMSLNG
jgi:hypothetical protein